MVRKIAPVKILAERVETMADFEGCKAIGVDLFQGYFFSKPNIVTGRDIPGLKLHYLGILQELQQEECDFAAIADLITADLSLSYKLLRYINSSYFGHSQKITSVRSALAMLGEINLRKWLSLMMMSYLAADKPSELISLCFVRAKFCELIGSRIDPQGTRMGKYHMVGMFSLLDAILDQSMRTLVAGINFSDDIKEVLLRETNSGPLAATFAFAEAYERGDWPMVTAIMARLQIAGDELPMLYEESIMFSRQVGML